jgi:hypothetical protein
MKQPDNLYLSETALIMADIEKIELCGLFCNFQREREIGCVALNLIPDIDLLCLSQLCVSAPRR